MVATTHVGAAGGTSFLRPECESVVRFSATGRASSLSVGGKSVLISIDLGLSFFRKRSSWKVGAKGHPILCHVAALRIIWTQCVASDGSTCWRASTSIAQPTVASRDRAPNVSRAPAPPPTCSSRISAICFDTSACAGGGRRVARRAPGVESCEQLHGWLLLCDRCTSCVRA